MNDIERAKAILDAGGWQVTANGNHHVDCDADSAAKDLAQAIAPALLEVLEASVRPAGPGDQHWHCLLCHVTARVPSARDLAHEPSCPVVVALTALREALAEPEADGG